MIGITIGRSPHDHRQDSLHHIPVRHLTSLILLKNLFNIQSAGMLRRKNQDQNQSYAAETWYYQRPTTGIYLAEYRVGREETLSTYLLGMHPTDVQSTAGYFSIYNIDSS